MKTTLTTLALAVSLPWMAAAEVLEGTTSPDGEFALVLGENDANVITYLPENRAVLRLGTDENFSDLYFPGMNKRELTVQWGPDQEGARFGLFFYNLDWESGWVYLATVDPEFGEQTDIDELLSEAAGRMEAEKGTKHADYYVFTFSSGGVVDPNGGLVITDPVDVKINYLGQVPTRGGPDMEWTEDAPSVEGSFVVRLIRGSDGPEAKVLGGSDASSPSGEAATSSAPGASAFKALRDEINDEVEADDIQKVKVREDGEAGRKLSYLGYVRGYDLLELVYVDSRDDENETYVIYYWRDGMLVSAYEVREGTDTEISEVAKTIEIYNFEDQQLVGWIRDGEEVALGEMDAGEVGARVLSDSITRSQPIFQKIGAD